jgi:hypothetical protein
MNCGRLRHQRLNSSEQDATLITIYTSIFQVHVVNISLVVDERRKYLDIEKVIWMLHIHACCKRMF